ncbi:hypothetical protein ACQJ0W_25730, partial [Klebsiella pneumoniae]|uniref:hypothetical protein n=1 Tax=Klebsiella pneumoniae TaxID=573 RepID=UPI003D00D2C6
MGHVYMTIERKDVIVKKSFKFNHLIMVAKGAGLRLFLRNKTPPPPRGDTGSDKFFLPRSNQRGCFWYLGVFWFVGGWGLRVFMAVNSRDGGKGKVL